MKLILKGHKEEYAAREIIGAYIPKIKIELTDTVPDYDDYLISELRSDSDKFIYETLLFIDGKNFKSSITEKEFLKNYVKKSISQVMQNATGISSLPWGLITGIRPSKIVREMSSQGKSREKIEDYFKNFYLCSDAKTKIACDVAYREKAIIDNMPPNSISLYIGIPFCPTRCLYCSFTSQSIKFSNTLTEPYMDALQKEMAHTANIIRANGLNIDTVYIGGGTPTALNESQLNRLLDNIYKYFDLSKIREFTVEAGRPDTINEEKLHIIKDHGISRISINPQSMNQKTLDIIGRCHTPQDIISTFEMASNLGFSHINMDLIAGLPNETEKDFENTLNEIERLNPQSVTVHTMSIKRGSFLDEKYSMYTYTAAQTVNNMLNSANERMAKLQKLPYYMYRQKNMLGNLENIGYCNPGHECIYNIYIMEEVQSIYAIGAGASTKIISGSKIDRVFNVKEVSEYIKRIDEMNKRKNVLLNTFNHQDSQNKEF